MHYRMLEAKAPEGQKTAPGNGQGEDDTAIVQARPDVTQKGQDMIAIFAPMRFT